MVSNYHKSEYNHDNCSVLHNYSADHLKVWSNLRMFLAHCNKLGENVINIHIIAMNGVSKIRTIYTIF